MSQTVINTSQTVIKMREESNASIAFDLLTSVEGPFQR